MCISCGLLKHKDTGGTEEQLTSFAFFFCNGWMDGCMVDFGFHHQNNSFFFSTSNDNAAN